MNLKEYVERGMSYAAFHQLIQQLLKENKTTGNDQSETYLAYARLNLHRMERVEKTLKLEDKLVKTVEKLKSPLTALVITEGWCGDSAQNIPVLGALDRPGKKLAVRIVLRDENPALMDQYLTNGARSIPKVIFMDEKGKALATWGPRPAPAQQIMTEGKAKGLPKDEISTAIHLWYSKNKTVTFQQELAEILKKIGQPVRQPF